MSGLVLKHVTKSFGSVQVVKDVTLDIPEGSFVCLLGPSGCGKTTLLRLIAGLDDPSGGDILLDGSDLTALPTHKRDLGMVFQSLALFPHLSVGENIRYPLKIRGRPLAEMKAREQALLEMVQLPGYGERAISQLSGGQRQRVAIARALALEPKLFLLDEPLSALDAKLRETMQVELRQLQQELGITTIVVTHDQREAMTMADMVVVMGEGRIRQAASPIEIYRKPADVFVADFIGATNLLPVELRAGSIQFLDHEIGKSSERDGKATMSIRPENVSLVTAGKGQINGTVRFIRDLGATVETFVEVGNHVITAVCVPRDRFDTSIGADVGLTFPMDHAVVLTK